MRNKARRYNVDKLFILGTGASYAASRRSRESTLEAPLDRDFASRILEIGESTTRPMWIKEAATRIHSEWKQHDHFVDAALEDAIARHLGQSEFLDSIHSKRRRNARSATDWLVDVVHLMNVVLGSAKESNHVYKDFCSKVFPDEQSARHARHWVVTFNYDTMLDQHLLRRFSLKEVYFDKLKASRGESLRGRAKFEHPLLIKLHGSINWRCEKEEFEYLLGGTHDDTPRYIEEIWQGGGKPSPDSDEFPLLVPPIPAKPITKLQLFEFLWTKAYEYLHEANELVICGYSLPPDRLASSLFSNFSNSTLKRVTVVDPDPSVLAKWQALIRRKGIATGAEWSYYDDFGDYVRRMP